MDLYSSCMRGHSYALSLTPLSCATGVLAVVIDDLALDKASWDIRTKLLRMDSKYSTFSDKFQFWVHLCKSNFYSRCRNIVFFF